MRQPRSSLAAAASNAPASRAEQATAEGRGPAIAGVQSVAPRAEGYARVRRWTVSSLFLAVSLLILAHFFVTYAKYVLGRDHLLGLERMFNVLKEANAPSWFSSSLLLVCAALLGVIAVAERASGRRRAAQWALLSGVFVFLSLDESAMVHETVQDVLRRGMEAGQPLFAATSVAFPLLLALAVLLSSLRLLRTLPRRTAKWFLLAGAVFVGGAVGVDYLGELHKIAYGDENLGYGMWNGLEESLEMSGVVLMVHALLDYLDTHVRPQLATTALDDRPA